MKIDTMNEETEEEALGDLMLSIRAEHPEFSANLDPMIDDTPYAFFASLAHYFSDLVELAHKGHISDYDFEFDHNPWKKIDQTHAQLIAPKIAEKFDTLLTLNLSNSKDLVTKGLIHHLSDCFQFNKLEQTSTFAFLSKKLQDLYEEDEEE